MNVQNGGTLPKHRNVFDHLSELETLIINLQGCHQTETSQLIYSANKLTGFYIMATLAFKKLMLT